MSNTPTSSADMQKLLGIFEAKWSEVAHEAEANSGDEFLAQQHLSIVAYIRSLEADLAFAEGRRANGNMVLVPADKLKEMQDELARHRSHLSVSA